jgi:subtilase family serine protease
VQTGARNSAPKDYSLFRHFIAFAGSPHIAVHSGIRQYTSVTITHKAETPEQHGTTKLHPIQRPEFPAKGKNLHATPMHTKANSLNALSFSVLLTLLTLLCPSQALFAQAPLKDRVVQAVDNSQVTAVKGNVHPMARPEFDQGRVDPSMPMRVTMTFKMTAAQQADLDALLAAQQQRGSPDYQRWLTPEQFGSRFGLSQGDINKVTGWLESEGFHVEGVPASRNMITFSGTAQQVESALHTEMHRYLVNGKAHFANASEPSVPAALSDVVLGFRSLDNFQLKPKALRKMSPKFTSGISGNHFITPPDFARIYNVNPLYQQGTGAGQKIVVVGQSNINLNDVVAFRTNSKLPVNGPCPGLNCPVQVVIVPGESDPGLVSTDIDEANLDVEWGGAIAYNATVIFIVGNPNSAGGVFDAIDYAITTRPAPVVSTSYGDCEADFPATALSSLKMLMQQANAEGITVLAPAGDTGPADCDFNSNSNSPVTASMKGLAVDLPGALESVTSVGGTEFQEGSDPSGIYWIPALGTDVNPSARMYIPEGAWNDTDITIGGVSTGLSAGGGGSSTVIPKPAWQAGTGVPNDGARDVPDISFSASAIHDGYLICSEDFNSSTNTFSPTCVNGFRRNDLQMTLTAVGGTSVGPPVMAGIVALINQFTNHPGSGNINTVLYPLAAHLPSAFHDVQSGNNQVPFSNPCGTSTKIGYNALPGYDLATGLGSIDVSAVVNNWTTVTPASTGNAAFSGDFSMAFTPGQLTVTRGGCGTGTLVLTGLNGFVGTPSFTCTVPATLGATTCAVTPAISTAFDVPGDYREIGWWGVVGVILAGIAFVLVSFRRTEAGDGDSRAWPRLVPGFALVTVLAIMIGCGGSSKSNSGSTFAVQVPSTAPVGSGTVTVNAMIGTLNHTATITVTTQ